MTLYFGHCLGGDGRRRVELGELDGGKIILPLPFGPCDLGALLPLRFGGGDSEVEQTLIAFFAFAFGEPAAGCGHFFGFGFSEESADPLAPLRVATCKQAPLVAADPLAPRCPWPTHGPHDPLAPLKAATCKQAPLMATTCAGDASSKIATHPAPHPPPPQPFAHSACGSHIFLRRPQGLTYPKG